MRLSCGRGRGACRKRNGPKVDPCGRPILITTTNLVTERIEWRQCGGSHLCLDNQKQKTGRAHPRACGSRWSACEFFTGRFFSAFCRHRDLAFEKVD
ncbi:hypothetical protein J6590_053992 [Homalodisca vitripennis]|nr:hypothetical protein J6590_053992 [Homalodisca vitripennis]